MCGREPRLLHTYIPPPLHPTRLFFFLRLTVLTLLCVYNTNGNDLIEEASDSQSVDLMINETEKKRRQRGRQSVVIFRLYKSCRGGGGSFLYYVRIERKADERKSLSKPIDAECIYRPSASMKVASYIVSSWLVEMAMNHHSFQFRADDG